MRIGDGGHGVRYATCGVCATEWHVTRIKCVPCLRTPATSPTRALDGAGGNGRTPAVKAETCPDCHSQPQDRLDGNATPLVDAFADDLATLALDMLVDETGFHRAGRNLFLFLAVSRWAG